MPSKLTRIFLFISSYFPLLVIFAVLNYDKYYIASLICLAVGLLSILFLLLHLRTAHDLSGSRFVVEKVRSKDAEAMVYVGTYIVPFIGFHFDDWRGIVSTMIFFVVVAIIYINSNLIFVNPLLNLFGYHMYEVEANGGTVHALISRRSHLEKDNSFVVVKIGNEVLMEATG